MSRHDRSPHFNSFSRFHTHYNPKTQYGRNSGKEHCYRYVGSAPHDVAALTLNSVISDSETIKNDIQLLLTSKTWLQVELLKTLLGGVYRGIGFLRIFHTPSCQGFPMSFITQNVNYPPLVDVYGGTNRCPVDQSVPVEFKGMYVYFDHVVTAQRLTLIT